MKRILNLTTHLGLTLTNLMTTTTLLLLHLQLQLLQVASERSLARTSLSSLLNGCVSKMVLLANVTAHLVVRLPEAKS